MIIVPKDTNTLHPITGAVVSPEMKVDLQGLLNDSFSKYAAFWQALQDGQWIEYVVPVEIKPIKIKLTGDKE